MPLLAETSLVVPAHGNAQEYAELRISDNPAANAEDLLQVVFLHHRLWRALSKKLSVLEHHDVIGVAQHLVS